MIQIDGSVGEGGGQVLRTAVGLSLVTGQAFHIRNIRSGRSKPGMLRQHLTAVDAAAQISSAKLSRIRPGGLELIFEPTSVRPGSYTFSVGSAGSTTLVLQTILPALMVADAPSTITMNGGTHNPMAPPFNFIDRSYLPLVQRMGPLFEAQLLRYGFAPAGGGSFELTVQPAALGRLDLPHAPVLIDMRVNALVAHLPISIAEREIRTAQQELGWPTECFSAASTQDSDGPGNVLTVEMESEQLTTVVTGFGRRGYPAEQVARDAAAVIRRMQASQATVCPHLADQLLIPMAMAGGGSFFCEYPSRHTTTNMDIIKKFVDVDFRTEKFDRNLVRVVVES